MQAFFAQLPAAGLKYILVPLHKFVGISQSNKSGLN